jgi:hypothetical protein
VRLHALHVLVVLTRRAPVSPAALHVPQVLIASLVRQFACLAYLVTIALLGAVALVTRISHVLLAIITLLGVLRLVAAVLEWFAQSATTALLVVLLRLSAQLVLLLIAPELQPVLTALQVLI